MKVTPKNLFAFFAAAEALTWGLLITGLILRSTIGIAPEIFFLVGASHGFTFLGFVSVSKLVGLNMRWSPGRIFLTASLAAVPFATVPLERRLHKSGGLEGEWRREKTSDPRDSSFIDSLFRWWIARPFLLTAYILVFLVALFSFLLWLGPPYKW
jgi:integral membrane protein